jgi:hypothetical protein
MDNARTLVLMLTVIHRCQDPLKAYFHFENGTNHPRLTILSDRTLSES